MKQYEQSCKKYFKIFPVGRATTIVRIIVRLSIPAGEQTILSPGVFAQRHHAAAFYCLWDFRLLPDCLPVSPYPESVEWKSGFTGAEIVLPAKMET